MNAAQRSIVAKVERAVLTGETVVLTRDEGRALRAIQAALPPPAALPYFAGVLGQFGGVSFVVERPKGYPTEVTPRARKKGRRR